MSNLHDTDIQIKLKNGLGSAINTTATKNSAITAEPHYTTDTHTLSVFDGTVNQSVTSNSPITSVSGNTTLDNTYEIVKVTAACTITLPAASGRTNKIFEIMAAADDVIVDGNDSETIQDELTQTLVSGDSMRIICDGSGWRFI